MGTSLYRCASVRCPGRHASPEHVCASRAGGGTGVFRCARIAPPCGLHAKASHVCPDRGEPHAWSCGRAEPPCPGHPDRRAKSRCTSGLWRCNRSVPPCEGHRRPGLVCRDVDVEKAPALPTTGHAKGAAPPSEGLRTLEVGINLPWSFQYCGYDFGRPPEGWRSKHPSPRRWDAELGETLRAFVDAGIGVVRFWLLADGVSLLRSETAELPEGFVADVRGLLDTLHAHGLRAIPSLTSFELFFPEQETKDGKRKRGFAELVLGDAKRGDESAIERFFGSTLAPLLAIPGPSAERLHPAVLAWEVMNEPSWCVEKRAVGAEAMSLFLHRGTRRIAASGHRVSIGFVRDHAPFLSPELESELRMLATDGRYLHQLHYYPRPGSAGCPARAETMLPTATIVGELGLVDSPSARWPDAATRESELEPAHYLEGRLRHLESLGYPLAMLWSRNATDDKSGWDPEIARQLRAFTSRPLRRASS